MCWPIPNKTLAFPKRALHTEQQAQRINPLCLLLHNDDLRDSMNINSSQNLNLTKEKDYG